MVVTKRVGSDQENFYENVIIGDHLEDTDGQFSLEEDVIINTWKEEFEIFSFEIQPNKLEGDFMGK